MYEKPLCMHTTTGNSHICVLPHKMGACEKTCWISLNWKDSRLSYSSTNHFNVSSLLFCFFLKGATTNYWFRIAIKIIIVWVLDWGNFDALHILFSAVVSYMWVMWKQAPHINFITCWAVGYYSQEHISVYPFLWSERRIQSLGWW